MTFAYHRSIGPLLGVLLGLAVVEMIVVHIVAMAYWGWKIAVALGLLDLSVVLSLAMLLQSFRTHPITLDDGMLTMRTGSRLAVPIPVANIAGFRDGWTAEDMKRRSVLNMALIAWPNIVLDLHEPVARRRRVIATVAHCVDDPVAFRARIDAAIGNAVIPAGG